MFHFGPELNGSTRASKGYAKLEGGALVVWNDTQTRSINGSDIQAITFYHFMGTRVIRIETGNSRIFLSAIRFMIGQVALGNYFGTGKLFDEIVRIGNAAVVYNETKGTLGWKRRLARVFVFAVIGFCAGALTTAALAFLQHR
jgi:hypothetical protein